MAAFPTSTSLTTDHLNDASDNPGNARTEIEASVNAVQDIIDSYDSASGIAALDSGGLIVNTKLPNTLISSSGNNLTLTPDTNVVKINNLVELTPRTTAQLNALTGVEGQIAYCSDGDGGSKCLAVYDGSNWFRISLGSAIST